MNTLTIFVLAAIISVIIAILGYVKQKGNVRLRWFIVYSFVIWMFWAFLMDRWIN